MTDETKAGETIDGTTAWGPMFPTNSDEIHATEPVADYASKDVLLKATPKDKVRITKVYEGVGKYPENFVVTRRTNTYHGPVVELKPTEDWDGEIQSYSLQCPDRYSNLVLWRAVTDSEGYILRYMKIARVSAKISDMAQYDICDGCGEPIKDPIHRSLAALGQCPGVES